jgi:uncharacterized protein YjbI with pentapeptide repeats
MKNGKGRGGRLGAVGLVVGLIVGGTVAFAGVTFAGTSPPTSVHTCTKVKHGVYSKTKITAGSSCPSGQFFQSWNNGSAAQAQIASLQAQNAALSKYKQLMADSIGDTPTISYAGVDFSNIDLPLYGLDVATFSGANFTNSFVTDDVTGTPSSWTSDDFTGANFTSAELGFGNYTSSNFTHANLTGANVTSATMTSSNFTDANLTSATFTGATMTSVTYSNTTCPNGTNSNMDGNTCAGQGGGL